MDVHFGGGSQTLVREVGPVPKEPYSKQSIPLLLKRAGAPNGSASSPPRKPNTKRPGLWASLIVAVDLSNPSP